MNVLRFDETHHFSGITLEEIYVRPNPELIAILALVRSDADWQLQVMERPDMPPPDLDERGRMVRPPLREFSRYIEQGMSCIVKLVIDNPQGGVQSVQFSMTADQCREIAKNLMTCAQVIELERPTAPK